MTTESRHINETLERYRAYLETLSWMQVNPRLRSKISKSDLIQDTLTKAFRNLHQIEALDEAARRRWLRRVLLNNPRDHVDRWLAAGRDVKRERALEASGRQSSGRLKDWLAADDPTPSEQVEAVEQQEQLLQALAELHERERQALILQRWHGWKLDEIAAQLNCTPRVVAGLLARGRARLNKLVPQDSR
jgi:RNA polymerase sigma-70 factor (ECF subfamily)